MANKLLSVTPEQTTFIADLAAFICRRGWRLPALIALQAGSPASFLGGQLLFVAEPALSLVMPSRWVQQTAHLLENPTAVNALIAQLEASEA